MRLLPALALLASTAAFAAPASAAVTVNLNGVTNASLNGANAVSQWFSAGTYNVTFTQDQYTAFSRFSSSTGCDGAGKNCTQGWENSARIVADGTTFDLGDGAANGGFGPISPGDGYYVDAATAFANAGGWVQQFTLAAAGNVKFFIYDDQLSDNRGGVSLSIAAVPEPATWALMILGFGLIGSAMRRRQNRTVQYGFA